MENLKLPLFKTENTDAEGNQTEILRKPPNTEKNWRVQNYPRMQAKISAGIDCLRFPRVTGGNLPAPAVNLGEAFIIHV